MKYRKFIITQKWFIDKKPYKQADAYDKYWLNLTKNAFGILEPHKKKYFKDEFGNEDIAEIAYAITSYFEDFISNIGIWKALRKKHIELYGTPVPFLVRNQENYNYEYINKEDIKFLLWRFLNIYSEYLEPYRLTDKYLDVLTDDLYNLFDKEYETAYETDYYNDFFKVSKQDDYFKIRDKIFWLSHSYLFDKITNTYILSKTDNIEINEEADLFEYQIYSITASEDSVYKQTTEFSALTVFDIFTELVKADDECKERLKEITIKHSGYFIFMSEDDKYLNFENYATKKEYKVLKDSMNEKMKTPDVGTMIIGGFILWNNDWWLSGIFVSLPDKTTLTDEEKSNFQKELYVYDKEYKEKMNEMPEIQGKDFQIFFKSKEIIYYNSGEKLEKDYNDFIQFTRKQRTSKSKEARKFAKKHKFNKVKLPVEFVKSDDICIFFEKNTGLAIIQEVKYFLSILDNINNNIVSDVQFACDYFANDTISYQFFSLLSKSYDLTVLGEVFHIPDFNIKQDLKALGRLYKFNDFKANIPTVTLSEDGKILPLDD